MNGQGAYSVRLAVQILCMGLLSFCSFSVAAQRSPIVRHTTAMGGSGASGHVMAQSIGQSSVIGTVTAEGAVVRQGYVQSPKSRTFSPEVETQWSVQVYPNPFSDQLTVSTPDSDVGVLHCSLIDMSGRELLSQRLQMASPKSISLGQLPSGAYLLRLEAYTPEGEVMGITTIPLVRR